MGSAGKVKAARAGIRRHVVRDACVVVVISLVCGMVRDCEGRCRVVDFSKSVANLWWVGFVECSKNARAVLANPSDFK